MNFRKKYIYYLPIQKIYSWKYIILISNILKRISQFCSEPGGMICHPASANNDSVNQPRVSCPGPACPRCWVDNEAALDTVIVTSLSRVMCRGEHTQSEYTANTGAADSFMMIQTLSICCHLSRPCVPRVRVFHQLPATARMSVALKMNCKIVSGVSRTKLLR